MNNLYHLIYASRETHNFNEDELLGLLTKARQANKTYNITGMLLYDKGSFFQVLEGDKDKIENLFSVISMDERHREIVRIIFEAIPERSFPDWSMGYSNISRKELDTIEGMNDFFDGGACLVDIDGGRAKKILKAFSAGRWRLI